MWTIVEKLISFTPQFLSWWLYSEEKTKKNIKINISAQEGTCEIICGESPTFKIWVEIHNGNVFSIDVDRILFEGNFGYSAQLYSDNLIGGLISSNTSDRFLLESYIEPSQLIKINNSKDDSLINYCEVKLILSNKYHKIRHKKSLERILCSVKNN